MGVAAIVTITPLGDSALVIGLGNGASATAWAIPAGMARRLRAAAWPWLIDAVPARGTVTVVYDPLLVQERLTTAMPLANGTAALPFDAAVAAISARLAIDDADDVPESSRVVEIPVCYGGAYGPDLTASAARSGMSEADFVALHCSVPYQVAMIGFMPGFPYLTGMPQAISQPRRPAPRSSVPAGSVGIAGGQTGIYPLTSPGGWQLIGRTPLRLFDPTLSEPSLLRAGDTLRFVPLGMDAMEQLSSRGGGT